MEVRLQLVQGLIVVVMMIRTGVLAFGRDLQWTMMMKVETANQQEHRQNSRHQPPRRLIGCLMAMQGMREQMKDGDAQHQSTDETGECLCGGVRHSPDCGQPATEQGRKHNCGAVGGEQPELPG